AEERKLVTRAAQGLVIYRSKQKKPPAKVSAQTLIRERDSWPSWAAHALPEAKPPPARVTVSYGTVAWDGMLVLTRIWKRDPPAPDVEVLAAAVPALESLADCVQGEWVNIYEHEHPRQAAAWRERFAKCGFQFPPAQSIETGEAHPVLGAVRKHGW